MFPLNQIIQGNTLEVLKTFPDDFIHLCVTSPPYFWKRNYGTPPIVWDDDKNCEHNWISFMRKGGYGGCNSNKLAIKETDNFQIFNGEQQKLCTKCNAYVCSLGLEIYVDLYIKHLVDIFREVRRVLRPDGSFYLNIGDTYAGVNSRLINKDEKLQLKNQIGIPARLLLAMQKDGWIYRQDLIWKKTNAFATSVNDTFHNIHEYILLFTKTQRAYFDELGSPEPIPPSTIPRKLAGVGEANKNSSSRVDGKCAADPRPNILNKICPVELQNIIKNLEGAKRKTVWTVSTAGLKYDHFASFGTSLIEIPLLTSSSQYNCSSCGAPYKRDIERIYIPTRPGLNTGTGKSGKDGDPYKDLHNSDMSKYRVTIGKKTLGWSPQCNCNAEKGKAIVLDPFMGSGTVAVTAIKHNRDYIGIELNPEYIKICNDRIAKISRGIWE
jgi:DNA modification methylase